MLSSPDAPETEPKNLTRFSILSCCAKRPNPVFPDPCHRSLQRLRPPPPHAPTAEPPRSDGGAVRLHTRRVDGGSQVGGHWDTQRGDRSRNKVKSLWLFACSDKQQLAFSPSDICLQYVMYSLALGFSFKKSIPWWLQMAVNIFFLIRKYLLYWLAFGL